MLCCCFCFFFNDTSPTVIYALSLHDALPISSTLLLTLLTATMEGSRTTMPLFFAYTSVFAVPRSIARSFENIERDRKSTRLNSSHVRISYAVFCLKKKIKHEQPKNGTTH